MGTRARMWASADSSSTALSTHIGGAVQPKGPSGAGSSTVRTLLGNSLEHADCNPFGAGENNLQGLLQNTRNPLAQLQSASSSLSSSLSAWLPGASQQPKTELRAGDGLSILTGVGSRLSVQQAARNVQHDSQRTVQIRQQQQLRRQQPPPPPQPRAWLPQIPQVPSMFKMFSSSLLNPWASTEGNTALQIAKQHMTEEQNSHSKQLSAVTGPQPVVPVPRPFGGLRTVHELLQEKHPELLDVMRPLQMSEQVLEQSVDKERRLNSWARASFDKRRSFRQSQGDDMFELLQLLQQEVPPASPTLVQAAKSGNMEACQNIIKEQQRTQTQRKDDRISHALIEAAKAGHADVCLMMLAQYPRAMCSKAVVEAARHGQAEVCRVLLQHLQQMQQQPDEDGIPRARFMHVQICRLLLEQCGLKGAAGKQDSVVAQLSPEVVGVLKHHLEDM